MARSNFGGTSGDFTFTATTILGKSVPRLVAASLTFWSAATGGTQYTDLLLNAVATSTIPVGTDGQIPSFQGPDSIAIMWADAGGARVKMVTSDGPTDVAVAGFAGDSASATRAALSATFASGMTPLAALGRIDKAKSGRFCVLAVGHSIANNRSSAVQVCGERLRTLYGAPPTTHIFPFGGGGSYVNPFLGWDKQPFSGRKIGRAVATSSSTAWPTVFYGDTVDVDCSRETDSGAANIKIDGVAVGTTPAAGSQLLGQRQTFTTTLGMHTLTMDPPASGKVYWEYGRGYSSADRGVDVIDATQGGTSVTQMVTAPGIAAPGIAPIATVGDNGINAHFDRDDYDVAWFMHDVNDAGLPPFTGASRTFAVTFKPSMDKIVAITKTRGKPLVLITSMGGHYNLLNDNGNDGRHAQFLEIRDYYKTLAAANNHVTHVDWDAATKMDDSVAYAARYYSAVSAVNVAAGTYTGDFIHPDTIPGHRVGQTLMADRLSLPPSPLVDADVVIAERFRALSSDPVQPVVVETSRLLAAAAVVTLATNVIDTIVPHGLAVGDKVSMENNVGGMGGMFGSTAYYVETVPSSTTFTIAATVGGAQIDITYGAGTVALNSNLYGYSKQRFSAPAGPAFAWMGGANGRLVPYFRSGVFNKHAALQTAINASGTSDKYGPYEVWSSKSVTAPSAFITTNTGQATYTLRASGTILIRLQGANIQAATPDGYVIPQTDPPNNRTDFSIVLPDSVPTVFSILIKTIGTSGISMAVTGSKVYEAGLTHGNVPILGL